MSEQPTAGARPPAGRKGPLGLSRTQWIIVGVAFAGALGYILWKRHTAAAATSTTTATPAATGNCTDAQGNSVPCAEQGSGVSAGALTALQDELDSILGGGAGGGSGTTGTVGTGGTSTATGTTATATGTSTATTTSGSTTSAAAAKKAGPISNLQASGVGKTTAKISWNPASNATGGYAYQVKQMNGKLVKSGNTHATTVSLSGLTSKYSYNFGVQGLPGGPGDNIHFTTS